MWDLITASFSVLEQAISANRKTITVALGLSCATACGVAACAKTINDQKKELNDIKKRMKDLENKYAKHDDIFDEILIPTKE